MKTSTDLKESEGAQAREHNTQDDQIGPLTFSPASNLTNHEHLDLSTSADNNQAKLMCWHCCLGHLSFDKLKQLVRNGKIPKKLAKTTPPRCTGYLFLHHDQSSLANKRQQVRQASLQGNKTRASCLSRPDDFNTARFWGTAQRQADHSTLQSIHRLCQPLLQPTLHTHDDKYLQ